MIKNTLLSFILHIALGVGMLALVSQPILLNSRTKESVALVIYKNKSIQKIKYQTATNSKKINAESLLLR